MKMGHHEERNFYKTESGCFSSLHRKNRVTDDTKEMLKEKGYPISDSLDLFFFPKDRYICQEVYSPGKKSCKSLEYTLSLVTYNHMNKPFLLIMKQMKKNSTELP